MIIPDKKQMVEIVGDGVDLDAWPVSEIPYRAEDGSIQGSGLRVQSNGNLLAPVGFSVESGSVDFGDVLRVSESATYLALENMVDKTRYQLLDYQVPRNGVSHRPYRLKLLEAERRVNGQSTGTSTLTSNPLVFDYTTQLTARTNALILTATQRMENVRIAIKDKASGVVIKYYPSKSSWITGENGTILDVGENTLDFMDTALIFEQGTPITFEIAANNVSLAGNAQGVAKLSAIVQQGEFVGIADLDDIENLQTQINDQSFDGQYSSLQGIPTSFTPAAHTHPISDIENLESQLNSLETEIQIVNDNVGDLATVATSGSYNDLVNKPSIPTNNTQLTNGAGYITLAEVPEVSISWNDVQNKPTSFNPSTHTHVISDVAGLQTALSNKMDVDAAISYNSLTDKPVLFSGNYNDLTSRPTFATVASTGSYNDLTNKPTIPTVNYPVRSVAGRQGDVVLSVDDLTGISTVGKTNNYSDLSNKPVIPHALSLTTAGTSGAATFNAATGALNIPNYVAPVNADWNASSGLSQILNKPTTLGGYGITDAVTQSSLSSTLGGYATTASLTSGLATKYNIPTGTTSQYVRGDGSLATFPVIPTNISQLTNDSGYITGITASQVSTALGYTPYNGTTNPNGYVSQAGARNSISLTTTGTSGAATYNAATGVLNIPNYPANPGTVTSITAGIGLTGGTITSSGTISMPNVGTAGTYSGNITTDAQGRVIGGTNRSFITPTRTLNTAFQINTTQDALVSYSVDISVAALLLAGTAGRVILEYADNAAMTTNLVSVSSSANSAGGVLNVATTATANLSGVIPAGKFVRLRTVNSSGTPTFTYQAGQEVLLG